MTTTISAILGASAPPRRIEHGGKTYEFKPLTQAVKSQWERWLEKKAIQAVRALDDGSDPASYEAMLEKTMKGVVKGVYGFYGPLSREAMLTPDGSLKLSSLLMGVEPDELVRLMAAKGDEVRASLDAVLSESLPRERPGPDGASMIEEEAPRPNS